MYDIVATEGISDHNLGEYGGPNDASFLRPQIPKFMIDMVFEPSLFSHDVIGCSGKANGKHGTSSCELLP